jgi:hypothetical protein
VAKESSVRRTPRGQGRAAVVIALVASLASLAEAAFTLDGLAIEDPATRDVVERYTLARSVQSVRFLGTVGVVDRLLDRPSLAATLARHLHPPLERYHIVRREDGSFDVNDLGALRGSFRLVAHGGNRRVYLCQGEFRSLAYLLKLSGSMVFSLDYRDAREGVDPVVEISPQIYVRLDNILVHGVLKVIGPLLNGVIDRRIASLTVATQAVGERIARDPEGLYREMQTWKDTRPEDLEAYRQAFLPEGRGQ